MPDLDRKLPKMYLTMPHKNVTILFLNFLFFISVIEKRPLIPKRLVSYTFIHSSSSHLHVYTHLLSYLLLYDCLSISHNLHLFCSPHFMRNQVRFFLHFLMSTQCHYLKEFHLTRYMCIPPLLIQWFPKMLKCYWAIPDNKSTPTLRSNDLIPP